jgi:UDP-N-acetylmuramyl pentapeptide synthase
VNYEVGGKRIVLIDESYNANPLSMQAALDAVWMRTRGKPEVTQTRRIAVLGDMRELGPTSRQLHADLLQPILDARIDLVFACGPHMSALYDALPAPLRGGYAERSEGLIQPLLDVVRPGDVIMIKGSLGTRMAPIVEALKTHLADLSAQQKD